MSQESLEHQEFIFHCFLAKASILYIQIILDVGLCDRHEKTARSRLCDLAY